MKLLFFKVLFFPWWGKKKCGSVLSSDLSTDHWIYICIYWLVSGCFRSLKYNLVVVDCCSLWNKRNYLWNPFYCSFCHKCFYSFENIFTGLAQQWMLLKHANKLLEASRIALESEIPPDVSQQLKSLLKWLAEPC